MFKPHVTSTLSAMAIFIVGASSASAQMVIKSDAINALLAKSEPIELSHPGDNDTEEFPDRLKRPQTRPAAQPTPSPYQPSYVPQDHQQLAMTSPEQAEKPGPANPITKISGFATNVHSATKVTVGKVTINLDGLEPMSGDEVCSSSVGNWFCGDQGKTYLSKQVIGKNLDCDIAGKDTEGNIIGSCAVNGFDLSTLVANAGHARPNSRASAAVNDAATSANMAGRGIYR